MTHGCKRRLYHVMQESERTTNLLRLDAAANFVHAG